MARYLAGWLVLVTSCGCARPNPPLTQSEPAAPASSAPSPAPSAEPAPLVSATPSMETQGPAAAPSAIPEPAPATSNSEVPPLANPWLGLTPAEVRAWVTGPSAELGQDRGVSLYGGARHLQITAKGWIVEWLPGGCSDWYWSVQLRFARGRVTSALENRRARYSGRYCN